MNQLFNFRCETTSDELRRDKIFSKKQPVDIFILVISTADEQQQLCPFNVRSSRPSRQPPRQPPRQPQSQNNSGFLGGFNEFLNLNFMNPLFPNQEPAEEGPQPRFHSRASKREKQKKKSEEHPKKQQMVYNENTGMYWKVKANQAFRDGNYKEALHHYNKAIELNNTESVFFSNRARCYKKMGRIEEALKDAQEACQLDVENIKGHLISGQILAEIAKRNKDLHKAQNSITRLTKALTLCLGQKKSLQFQHEISTYIYRAKKLMWYLRLEEIRSRRIQAINDYRNYLQKDQSLSKEEIEGKLNEFISATNEDIIFQIPDYLCCRITLDLMEDPVVTDSGQVYERTAIQEHVDRNGKTDPFTRKPIYGSLYPCIAIKKAIEDFLQKNPWAYEYVEGETYQDIVF